uniref:hypothetical protein n=1 Tax=Candidatus Electrothrix sp. TaxID=2170559 RepID=UPI004056A9E3
MKVLDESRVGRVKEVFKAAYQAMEEAKTYNESARDMKSSLAKELEVKTEVINSAYSQWVKQIEKPDVVEAVDRILDIFA